MKKTLTLLTGIVFLITILAATACNSGQGQNVPAAKDSDPEVQLIFIHCSAVEIDGELHFTMWDRNKDTIATTRSSKDALKLVNNLTTEVKAGDLVLWQWDRNSEVRTFINVAPPPAGKKKIIPGPAKLVNERRTARLWIPTTAEHGEESYYIEFDWKGETVKVDPHLKVPKEE